MLLVPPAPIVIESEPPLNARYLIAVPPAAPPEFKPVLIPPPPPVIVSRHLVTPAGTAQVVDEVMATEAVKPPTTGAVDAHVVPLLVRTFPLALGATA
jgi:hypothetical protein